MTSATPRPHPAQDRDADLPSVLLVDDHPENLLAMEAVLESLDVRIVRAGSAAEALRLAREREFAVILLDVQMPEMDGYEVARRIKAQEGPHLTPIIFVTALDRDRRHVHAGYESGAVDYLFKPVDPDTLRSKVLAFVRLHDEREAEIRRQRRRYADLSEAAIRESEARYRALFESIDAGFCVIEVLLDPAGRPADYRFLETNPAFVRQTGLEGAVGRTVRELVPDIEEHWIERYGRVALTGEPVRFQSGSDAMHRWFDVYAFRIDRPEDRHVALLFTDVSARREAERERERLLAELEVERSRLAYVFQRAPAFLAVLRGPDHVFTLVNEAYYQLVGHREILGRRVVDALPEVRDQGFHELLDRVLATGEPFVGRELRVMLARTPGAPPDERFVDLTYLPLVEGDGVRSGVIAHGTDVTAHVLARREVERARDRADRMLALTAALAATTTPGDVADVVAARGLAAMGAATAMLALRDAAAHADDVPAGVIVRQQGLPAGVVAARSRFPLTGPWPAAVCMRTGAPIFLESPGAVRAAFPESVDAWEAMGTQALATIPLTVAGETIGAMSFTWTTSRLLPLEDREFFLALGRQAAQALERARLLAAEREARERLERATQEAEEANRAKSGFLATMSHELRTPINAIIGYAQLLDIGLAGPVTDQQRGYLDRLAASSHHLLGLINDVLDLSKIEAGETRVAHADARTGPPVRAALDLVSPLASTREVRLVDARPDDDGVAFVGDEDRVRQVVLNLLSNAVKFTPAGGTVTVGCDAVSETPHAAAGVLRGGGPWAYVRVTDTGIGIAPEQQGRIFEPFHQVDEGHTRTQGGTGLGLAISRRLARLMGGDLTVESALGAGAAFTLWLPAARRDGDRAESAAERSARATRETDLLQVRGLDEIGELLRGAVDDILAAYAERLRADASIPQAATMSRAQLEDHAVSLLGDLAQSLVIVGEAGPHAAELLKDGSTIHRAIAEAHGARRFAQGWSEAAVRRDHQVLREEVERAIRGRLHQEGREVESAIRLLMLLIDRAEAMSRRAWRHAADQSERG